MHSPPLWTASSTPAQRLLAAAAAQDALRKTEVDDRSERYQAMIMKLAVVGWGVLLSAGAAQAQFTGPSAQGQPMTVAAAAQARLKSYVTMIGSVIAHLRGDYFQFRDDSGEVRVEIADGVWAGRSIGQKDTVPLMGEVDRGGSGVYLWIKTLDLVE